MKARLARLKQFASGFQARIFIAFTLLTLLIALWVMAVAVNNEVRNYRERANERVRLLAVMLADTVRLPLFAGDVPTLERAADNLLALPQVARITIRDVEGRVLVNRIVRPALEADAATTASAPVIAASGSPAADSALSGIPAVAPSSVGTVTVVIDTSDLRRAIRMTLAKSCAVVLLFWLAVLAVTYPVLKRITRSFHTLISGLDTMKEGDFTLKIAVDSDDEAGRAAQAVNRLAAALREREAENRTLQAELVSAMRLEVQEEKRMMMAKLIQTNRMTSLGLLISSMAHNINTPNGAIKLAAQHIQRSWHDMRPLLESLTREEGDFQVGGLPFSEEEKEFSSAVESICRNAERVERVVQDLRTYNVGERSRFSREMAVNRAVEGALTIIRAHGRQAEIAINLRLAADLPLVTGNQHQIEQVVVNLLLNAMQAMTEEIGSVTVTTSYDDQAGEVLIVVADEGGGIPEGVMSHLFEPFFSTKLHKGGSGLGLYISNFIVTEHKGRLILESTPGIGTVATIRLPATADSAPLGCSNA